MPDLVQGLIVPSITVFKNDSEQTIDGPATQRHMDWLIRNGADAIVPGGSSGEFPALTLDESKYLFDLAMEVAKGRAHVYAAACRYATRDVISLVQHAERIEANGVMIIVPYYMKPDEVTILEHFRTIRTHTGLPIILYNNPATVGVDLSHEAILRLAKEGVIQGVKSSHGDPEPTLQLVKDAPSLMSYYGHDFHPLQPLQLGAHGWFSLSPNIFPGQAARIVHERRSDEGIARCVDFVWGGEGHPVSCVKAALEIQGKEVGVPRLPLLPLRAEARAGLETILRETSIV
jgi:4-hydroxy-tetrahydrodipicolinate synthase